MLAVCDSSGSGLMRRDAMVEMMAVVSCDLGQHEVVVVGWSATIRDIFVSFF